MERSFRVLMAPVWRRHFNVGLGLWLLSVVLLEIFNETLPFGGGNSDGTATPNQIGLRWTLIAQVRRRGDGG